jgi:hypothetical protein
VSDFFLLLEEIVPKFSNLMVMGDFNLHIKDDNNTIEEFNNSLYALGLVQHVNFPTHVHGQSLDLVITEVANGIDILSCEPSLFLSDHCAVKVITKVRKENIVSKSVVFRNFKDMDDIQFSDDLSQISICSESVDKCIEQFEDEIKNLLNKHAPMKEKMQIYRAPKPWFNEDIHIMKSKARRAEKLWRKYRQPRDYENFKHSLNNYHHALKQERELVLSQKVLDSKGDTKKALQVYEGSNRKCIRKPFANCGRRK